MATYYVNTGSTAGGDGTTNATTGDSRAYASLSEAEAAIPDPLTENWEIICTGTAADTTPVAVSTTPSDTYTITIRAADGDMPGTSWDTGKYRISTGSTAAYPYSALLMHNMYTIGIQSETANNTYRALYISNTNATYRNVMSRCIGRHTSTAGAGVVIMAGTSLGTQAINCIGIHARRSGTTGSPYVFIIGSASAAYSCTAIGAEYGFSLGDGATAKNCYAGLSTAADFWNNNSGDLANSTVVNCASEDATLSAKGTNCLSGVACATASGAYFTNITWDSENLAIGASSGLLAQGLNTSADGAPFDYTTDINDDTRPTTWSIGADDIPGAAAAGLPVPHPLARVFSGPFRGV